MRVVRHLVLGALVSVVCYGASYATLGGQGMDAAQVLAAARQALGGEKTLSSVTTFVATGRTRQLRGNNLVPIEFEINCELPDKFVRRDEIPAQDTDPSTTGFAGDTLIQIPAPAQGPPRGGGPPPAGRGPGGPPPAQQRVVAIKQDFARLMLGVFAGSFPSYPLTLTYAAEGDAPEGKADILNVAGPANFSARLVVQRDTHLPVMLMWEVPAPPQGARGPAAAPGAAAAPATPAAPAAPVEYRMYYADFRDVNGIKWPFRIRRAIAGNTVEETTFDRVRINVKIDPKKFEVPK